jgi:CubicO group peptidase (beta-lactamase class C family)
MPRLPHAAVLTLALTGIAAAFANAIPPAATRPVAVDLAPIAARHGVPALTAAVHHRGETTVASTGRRARDADATVSDDDLWHIGSCTKAITATLLATYVAEDRITWDTTLADALPDQRSLMSETAARATLADLVRHRAGMPGSMPLALGIRLRSMPPDEGRAAIVAEGLRTAAFGEAGPTTTYSNTGFVVAGAICERLGGAPWEQLVADRILAPLQITDAGFGPPPTGDDRAAPTNPVGHTGGAIFRPAVPGADNPAAMGPAGTMHLTMRAWATFTALHLRGDDLADGERDAIGLSRADYAELHRPDGEFAAGWIVGTRPWARGDEPDARGAILLHAGSNTRWYAVAWLAPERNLSLLTATNLGDLPAAARATDEAVQAMLAAADRLEPEPD